MSLLLWPLGALALLAVVNSLSLPGLRGFRRVRLPARPPRVSVLVPARDEADNLRSLLPQLLAQDYPDFEVLVLDDRSCDGTAGVVSEVAANDSRLRLVTGEPLPAGWLGKPHACQQLAGRAAGELLVFTDADTLWAPDALGLLARAWLGTGADALSAWPDQRPCGPFSRLVHPVQQWSVLSFLPIPLVGHAGYPAAVAANGQLLAFRRGLYDRVGGHAAARGSVVEDMWLARAAKRAGGRFALLDATGVVGCRMYRTDAEVWSGFAKNVYPGLGASPPALAGTLLVVLGLFVGPWVGLGLALARGEGVGEPLAAVVLSLVGRALSDLRFGYPLGLVPLHPLSVLAWAAIALESARRYHRGRVAWKGRAYDLRGSS